MPLQLVLGAAQRRTAGILTAPDEKRWVELYELLLGAPAPLLDQQ